MIVMGRSSLSKRLCLIILALLFVVNASLSGQKVTLVLSGGGSWGAGHIGVLKALEENGIPIDCIVGTSAGAVVGGLYSIGYTPDEIEQLMSSAKFQNWAQGMIDDENIFYFQNDNINASLINLNVDPGKKISSIVPTHVYSSDQIDFEVMAMLSPANAVARENFDSLLVPFRCVVSDISHTKAVVLRKGDLGRAVRGSMAIPFVYPPIVIDSTLLYDGGIFENFPFQTAISEFHPDVIIGSKVTKRTPDASLDDPLLQVIHLIQAEQPDTITFSPSIVIHPNRPPKIGMLNFSESKRLADSGYVATIRKMPEIKKCISRTVDIKEFERRRANFKARFPELIFDSVRVTGPRKVEAINIGQVLIAPGERININKLEPEYFKLYGNGNITSMSPRAIYDTLRNAFRLDIDVHKAPPLNFRVGGNISLSSFNEGFAELKYNPLWKRPMYLLVNGYFGMPYASGMVAGRIYFNHPHTWFIGGSLVYNRFSYFSSTAYFFDVQPRSTITEKMLSTNIHVGIPVGNKAIFKFGSNFSTAYGLYYLSKELTAIDTLTKTKFRYSNPTISYDYYTLNRKQYANAGLNMHFSVSLISGVETNIKGNFSALAQGESASRTWIKAEALYEKYFHISKYLTGGAQLEMSVSSQPMFSSYMQALTYCQPFQPLPESKTLFLPGYRAPSWGAAGIKAIVKIVRDVELRNEVYYYQPYQSIEYNNTTHLAEYKRPFEGHSYISSAKLVWNAFLGPISIGLDYYSNSTDKLMFTVNLGYIFFNPGRPE
jgi:NTE family protein